MTMDERSSEGTKRTMSAVSLRREWQWYERGNVFSELIGPIPRDAFHTKEFSDLRIATSDGSVDAHQIVVAAASPLMRRSLAATAAANVDEGFALVIMPDFTNAQVESALRLFYGIASLDECDFEDVREFILPDAAAAAGVRGEPWGKRRQKGIKNVPRRRACPEPGCSFAASTVKALHAHSGTVHRAVPCALCNAQVKFEDSSRHLEDLHGGGGWDSQKIDFLRAKTKPPTQGRGPQPFVANAAGEYCCPRDDCEAVETSLAAIRSHYRAHASAVCDVCGKRVLKHNIKNHKAKHQESASAPPGDGGERPKFGCKHCGSAYSDNYALRVHLRVKHDEGDLEFKCDLCRACFVRKTAFAAHVSRCRLKDSVKTRRCIKKPVDPNSEYSKFMVPVDPDKPSQCPEPECNYENPRFLKRHYLDKHVTKVCPHCNKTFTYNHFDRHVKTMHTKKFDFRCSEPGCNEEFYNRRLLECHREESHVKELKYTCHHCARMFFSRYRLATHVTRTHNSPKYFPCPHEGCGKTYNDGSSLKKHLRRYHPEQVEATPF